MHGELMKSRCESCSRPPFDDRVAHSSVPRCACGARVRPHIVWFGEVPFEMDRIARELDACDVFVTIGSSGSVYPAAGFVSAFARAQAAAAGRRGPCTSGPKSPTTRGCSTNAVSGARATSFRPSSTRTDFS